MVRLRSSDTSLPGFRRRRRGRGFSYEDELGAPLADPAALERIRQLSIPPAWRNVWIAPWANGHIQALGVDAAGRRQYLYHRAWRERRDAEKFERMLEFATALPAARAVVQRQIVAAGLGRERVLACAFRLLDRGFFRIGGETYAEENQTFGLATLRSSHVRLVGTDGIRFDFAAKGGLRRTQLLVDPDAASVVRALRSRRGGGELLAYRDRTGWTDVRSADVNDYLRELVGCPCSAKDFRTWHATVLAAVSIAIGGGLATSERARNRAIVRATDEVAHYLGNTRAVCRASYIDPRVFEAYRGGRTIAGALGGVVELETEGEPMLESAERAVVELIGAAGAGSQSAPRRRHDGSRPAATGSKLIAGAVSRDRDGGSEPRSAMAVWAVASRVSLQRNATRRLTSMHEDDLSGTRLGQLAQRARALGIDPTGLDRDELIEEINAMGHDDSSELAQRQMREAEPAR